jgi:Protein of unknown function (DUF3102)
VRWEARRVEVMQMSSKSEISSAELQSVAERIKLLRQKATEHAVEIGRELLRVKASLPHGAFVTWVERACEFKIRTAQDLMKLARAAGTNAQLVALMVPSTLRVYLSKTTPADVRGTILGRLEKGERVSRTHLHTAIATGRAKAEIVSLAPRNRADLARQPTSDLLAPGEVSCDLHGDRSRQVAELLLSRLSREDYENIMHEMTWGVWNRVFVWMRAAQPPSHSSEPAAACIGRSLRAATSDA